MKLIRLLLAVLLFSAPAWAQESISRVQQSWIAVTPIVDTGGAYSAKDDIGGLLTFTNIVCKNSRTVTIHSVMITDKSDNAVDYDVELFQSNPSTSTITDQAAFDPSDTDLYTKMLPTVTLSSTQTHYSYNDNGKSSLSSLASGAFVVTAGAPIYAALVSRGTPTYTAASDVTVLLGVTCNG